MAWKWTKTKLNRDQSWTKKWNLLTICDLWKALGLRFLFKPKINNFHMLCHNVVYYDIASLLGTQSIRLIFHFIIKWLVSVA